MRIPTSTAILALVLFTILQSCTSKKSVSYKYPEVIKLNLDDKKRASLGVTIEKIIPLETNENSLIGGISKAEYFDNRIFILDRFKRNALFVFDEEGEFIAKSTKGKGPGELVDPFAFTIRSEDSVLILHDQAQGYNYFYDLDFNYIRRLRLDRNVFIMDFDHIRSDTFLVYHHNRTDASVTAPKSYSYTLYTQGFAKQKHLDILLDTKLVAQTLRRPVSISNNEVLFVAPWGRNIYQLVKGQERIRYTIDFGKYNITSKEFETFSWEELRQKTRQGSRFGTINSMVKTDDFLILMFSFKGKYWTYFLSLDTKEMYCLNDCYDSGLIPDCKIWGVQPDGTFYGMVEPIQLMEFQQSSGQYKTLEVSESDNPYVVLFKIENP